VADAAARTRVSRAARGQRAATGGPENELMGEARAASNHYTALNYLTGGGGDADGEAPLMFRLSSFVFAFFLSKTTFATQAAHTENERSVHVHADAFDSLQLPARSRQWSRALRPRTLPPF
jgi:hypothetical protein